MLPAMPSLPRFSLRLLLRTVAVLCMFCAWLGHQRSLVLERHAALAEFAEDPSFRSLTVKERDEISARMHLVCVDVVSIPIWRQWMGDTPIQTISYRPHADAEAIERAHRLFPEAIYVGEWGKDRPRRVP
jgi:hypothetical protein